MSSTGVPHFSADDQFLLISARKGRRHYVDPRGSDVVLLDDSFGIGPRTGPIDQEALHVRCLGLVAEHPVLPKRRLK
jgi:hypothetical protein